MINWLASLSMKSVVTVASVSAAATGSAVIINQQYPDLLDSVGLFVVEEKPMEEPVALLKPPNASETKVEKPSAPKAGAADSEEPETKSEELSTINPPTFDVMRVEKDGSVLVAGAAEPNSTVDLMLSDGTVIGSTKSGSAGDFVILPDQPLKPGDYAVSLRSKTTDGQETFSIQSGVIHVPEQGGEVLALLSEKGKPSQIVAKPQMLEIKQLPAQKPVAEKQPEPAEKAEPPKEPATVAVEEAPKPVEPKEVAKVDEPPKPEPIPVKPETAIPQVIVEAVEVEGDQIFIAGAVPKGSTVRIYIDNESIGTGRGTGDDRFLVSRKFKLSAGKHTVRADVIDRKTGQVLSRAEVPLLHEVAEILEPKPEVVAVVPTSAPLQPEQSEVAKEVQVAAVEPTNPPKVISDAVEPAKEVAVAAPLPKKANPAKPETAVVAKPIVEPAAPLEKAEVIPQVAKQPEPKGPLVIRTGRAVIIKPGDNLWRISRKTYGRGIRYTTIYNANRRQIRNPNRIYIGQIFKIPQKDQQETALQ